MIKSGFFNSINEDRTYNAEDFNRFLSGIVTYGIFENVYNRFEVSLNLSGEITVSTGKAWLNDIWIINDSTINFVPPENLTSNHVRIDYVILQINKGTRECDILYISDGNLDNDNPFIHNYILAEIHVNTNNTAIIIDNYVGTDRMPYVMSLTSNDVSILDKYVQKIGDVMSGSLTIEGSGEEVLPEGIIKIFTKNDLIAFRDRVNAGEYSLDAILMSNIDLGGENWVPIGNDISNTTPNNYYSGYFDGNGYTVSNFNCTYNHAGLFGVLRNGAVIQNISVNNAIITNQGGAGVTTGSGGVLFANNDGVGQPVIIKNIYISDCIVICQNGYAGGLTGVVNRADISNVTIENVSIMLRYNGRKIYGIGGISGLSVDVVLKGCYINNLNINFEIVSDVMVAVCGITTFIPNSGDTNTSIISSYVNNITYNNFSEEMLLKTYPIVPNINDISGEVTVISSYYVSDTEINSPVPGVTRVYTIHDLNNAITIMNNSLQPYDIFYVNGLENPPYISKAKPFIPYIQTPSLNVVGTANVRKIIVDGVDIMELINDDTIDLSTKLDELAERTYVLESNMEYVQNDILGLQSAINTLNTEVGSLISSMTTLETEVGTFTSAISTLEGDVLDLETNKMDKSGGTFTGDVYIAPVPNGNSSRALYFKTPNGQTLRMMLFQEGDNYYLQFHDKNNKVMAFDAVRGIYIDGGGWINPKDLLSKITGGTIEGPISFTEGITNPITLRKWTDWYSGHIKFDSWEDYTDPDTGVVTRKPSSISMRSDMIGGTSTDTETIPLFTIFKSTPPFQKYIDIHPDKGISGHWSGGDWINPKDLLSKITGGYVNADFGLSNQTGENVRKLSYNFKLRSKRNDEEVSTTIIRSVGDETDYPFIQIINDGAGYWDSNGNWIQTTSPGAVIASFSRDKGLSIGTSGFIKLENFLRKDLSAMQKMIGALLIEINQGATGFFLTSNQVESVATETTPVVDQYTPYMNLSPNLNSGQNKFLLRGQRTSLPENNHLKFIIGDSRAGWEWKEVRLHHDGIIFPGTGRIMPAPIPKISEGLGQIRSFISGGPYATTPANTTWAILSAWADPNRYEANSFSNYMYAARVISNSMIGLHHDKLLIPGNTDIATHLDVGDKHVIVLAIRIQ